MQFTGRGAATVYGDDEIEGHLGVGGDIGQREGDVVAAVDAQAAEGCHIQREAGGRRCPLIAVEEGVADCVPCTDRPRTGVQG